MCRADMTFAVDGVLHNQLSVRLTHFRSYTMYSAALIIRTFAVDWMLKKQKQKHNYLLVSHVSGLTLYAELIVITFAIDWALKHHFNYLSVSPISGLTLCVAMIPPLL